MRWCFGGSGTSRTFKDILSDFRFNQRKFFSLALIVDSMIYFVTGYEIF